MPYILQVTKQSKGKVTIRTTQGSFKVALSKHKGDFKIY